MYPGGTTVKAKLMGLIDARFLCWSPLRADGRKITQVSLLEQKYNLELQAPRLIQWWITTIQSATWQRTQQSWAMCHSACSNKTQGQVKMLQLHAIVTLRMCINILLYMYVSKCNSNHWICYLCSISSIYTFCIIHYNYISFESLQTHFSNALTILFFLSNVLEQ